MTVIYIRPSREKGYLNIGVSLGEEKRSLTVSEREYGEAGSPLRNESIGVEVFFDLCLADERYRAMRKALNVLSYGDNSEKMLMRKLTLSGISRQIAEETVKKTVKLGYINSERQLEKLIFCEVNEKNHGPIKIIPRLAAKGYSTNEIKRVISRLADEGKIDFDAAKQRLISKKADSDATDEEIKKLLYKNGYSVC